MRNKNKYGIQQMYETIRQNKLHWKIKIKTVIFQITANEFRNLIKNFKYFIVLLTKQ